MWQARRKGANATNATKLAVCAGAAQQQFEAATPLPCTHNTRTCIAALACLQYLQPRVVMMAT
jgi:hypothetical protein